MTHIRNVFICLVAALTLTASNLFASPQDQYLQIYLLIQEGEKLESSGKKAAAKERYEIGLGRLEKLQKEFPDWEPVIVRYRVNFCKDKVQSLQNVTDTGSDDEDTSVASSSSPTVREIPDTSSPQPSPRPSATLSVPTSITSAASSSISSSSTSETALSSSTSESSETDISLLKARIKELESELAETKLKLSTSSSEASELKSRQRLLEAQIESLRQGGSDTKLNEVLEQNKLLQDQLARTRSDLQKLQTGSTAITLASLQEELKNAQEQIATLNQQKGLLQSENDQYKQQLQNLQAKLASAPSSKKGSSSADRENKILRDIINRQLKEQTRRETARRVALDELNRLTVESATLKTQIDILSSPIVTLNEEEKEILQTLKASLVVDNQGNISTTINRPTPDYSTTPKVPEDFRDVAEQAVQLFANRRFEEAASKYQVILNTHPDSLYALSNLGVVRFQQQKYPEAEKALREAIRLSPQDSFSHSILGIVLYQQGKYDDAVQILSRAVALDPKDPKTRNYLGIAASQKGWQDAAEQECRTAIELDENYGDAHFNLAVIYATQNPPSKELARRHYNRAIALGVPKDDQLEKLLN